MPHSVQYDAAQMADLRAREAELVKDRAEVATRMHERARGDDKTWDAPQTNAHTADMATLSQYDSGLKEVRHAIQMMTAVKPKTKAETEAPFRRWLNRRDMDSDELGQFIGEKNSGISAGPSSDMFTIPSSPDGYEAAMGRPAYNPMMAPLVPTPTKSDTTGTSGGHVLVPVDQQFLSTLIEELQYIGGALSAVFNFETGDGGDLPMISMDDASNEGEILGAQDTTVTNLAMPNPTRITFTAKTASSKFFYLTNELIADSQFDIQGHANRTAMRRIARICNKVITTNGHDATPQGIVPTAKSGITSSNNYSFTASELSDLIYQIDRAYRMGSEGVGDGAMAIGGGTIGYMWSDDAERVARKLVDTQNRPLWLPSIRDGMPPTMHGIPAIVNGHMDKVAAGNVPVLYGNFSYYGMRRVSGGTTFFRIQDSTSLRNNATAFIAFKRFDGRWRLPKNASGAHQNQVEVVAKLTMAS